MKNKIFFNIVLFVILSFVGLSSCDKDSTGGNTGITYYPTLELVGETSMIIDKGVPYVDPGYSAVLIGEDVTDQVNITSDVNTDVAGVYSILYEITNADGFKVSSSRTIYVADPTPSPISTGIHNVEVGTHRINQNTGLRTDYSGYEILFLQTEPGVFYVSDFLGGYYDKKAGYGSNYAMTGYFRLSGDNSLSLLSSKVSAWGDSADQMKDASFDPALGVITWSIDYAGFLEFNVTIN